MRSKWLRILPGDDDFTSDHVIQLLDFHYGSGETHVADWFPDRKYRVTENCNYLVDPLISNEILVPGEHDDEAILARACFLADPWHVTEKTWLAFSWESRVVYITHFRDGDKNNVYKRLRIAFNNIPKPSWSDLKRWEEDSQIADLVEHRSSNSIGRRLQESQDVLLEAGHPLNFLETAKATLTKRILKSKEPVFHKRGGLETGATAEEIRTVKVQALNSIGAALDPTALDTAMISEVKRIRAEL